MSHFRLKKIICDGKFHLVSCCKNLCDGNFYTVSYYENLNKLTKPQKWHVLKNVGTRMEHQTR